jgi:hypothetical protein
MSRPRFLIFLTLLLALFQITNALTVLQLPETITNRLSLPVWFNVGLSGAWALAFGFSAVHLCRRGINAVRYANWLIVAFIGYSWLRLVIFAQADYDRGRLPFLSVLVLLGLVLLVWRITRTGQQHHSSGERHTNDQ